MTEKQIQNAILRTLGKRTDLRIWRANAGTARFAGRSVQFGVPGQADLTGILADGRRLEIEVKSATGRQSEEQRNFERLIVSMRGIYILARSVEDVLEVIDGHT